MNYDQLLIDIYKKAKDTKKISIDNKERIKNITTLVQNISTQKAVFTVFVTLAIYKIKHKKQDIRYHQVELKNEQYGISGFSGRSIDTKYITPTLRSLKLPSMAESGWLTRSLEQPRPFYLDFEGKIKNKEVKKSFLELVDDIQVKKIDPTDILIELFRQLIVQEKSNKIKIVPLKNKDSLTVLKVAKLLEQHFTFNYKVSGGSKLPVIAFYSIYKLLVKELKRYNTCILKYLNSHTASDKSSKSAGDIEIFENDVLFEAFEIKLNRQINKEVLEIAKEKIYKHNPKRYYILSNIDVQSEYLKDIENIINEVKKEHGCQIIVNGLVHTLKYYLRLINSVEEFIKIYSNLIINDTELQLIHKTKWNELVKGLNSEI